MTSPLVTALIGEPYGPARSMPVCMRPQRHLKPEVRTPTPGRTYSGRCLTGATRRVREARAGARDGPAEGPSSRARSRWFETIVWRSAMTTGDDAAAAVTEIGAGPLWGSTANPPRATPTLASRTAGSTVVRRRGGAGAAWRGVRDGGKCRGSEIRGQRCASAPIQPPARTRRPAQEQRAVIRTLQDPERRGQLGWVCQGLRLLRRGCPPERGGRGYAAAVPAPARPG